MRQHTSLIEALTGRAFDSKAAAAPAEPTADDLIRRKAHARRLAAASSVTGAPGGYCEMVPRHESLRAEISAALDGA